VTCRDVPSSSSTISSAAAPPCGEPLPPAGTGGAARIACAASHGLFTAAGIDLLAEPALEQLVITDSVPPPHLEPSARNVKLVVISVAPLFAEAIRRLHREESLVELLEA